MVKEPPVGGPHSWLPSRWKRFRPAFLLEGALESGAVDEDLPRATPLFPL